MSLRTFVDSGGGEWQVFDVSPRKVERRTRERRAFGGPPESPRDRRENERRLSLGDLGRLRTIREGWLCFERDSDCRRLSPIPSDWRHCPDGVLERYCQSARRIHPPMIAIR
jgi:hypothetical protein